MNFYELHRSIPAHLFYILSTPRLWIPRIRAQDRLFGHLKPLPNNWIRITSKSSGRLQKRGACGGWGGGQKGDLYLDGCLWVNIQ